MACGSQFGLLLWKNWLLQKRKVALTIFEIALPAIAAILLFGTKQLTDYTVISNPTTWESFKVNNFYDGLNSPARLKCNRSFSNYQNSLCYNTTKWKLAFTPNNTAMINLMNEVATQQDVNVVGMGFADETTMKDFLILEEPDSLNTLGGIVVTTAFPTDSTFPDKVVYKIRLKSDQQAFRDDWKTGFQYDDNRFRLGPRAGWLMYSGNPDYYTKGFLQLQKAFDTALILQHNSLAQVDTVSVELQRFPYPPYTNDVFIVVISTQLPFLVMLSFILLALSIVKDVVLEKEKKLKESMKLMGLSNWLHWSAWFLKYFIFLSISSLIMTIFFKINLGNGAVITKTDGTLVFITLIFYSIATIMFCFAISVFFSKSNTGAAAGGVLFFLSYVPYFLIPNRYSTMSLGMKSLACLLPNIAMAMGFNLISQSEIAGIGIQWSNFAQRVNVDDEFTLAHTLFFLLLDTFIAFLITWYIDAVRPGEYGVPKPFYFCCTKWYWCGGERGGYADNELNAENVNSGEFFEPRNNKIRAGVQIKGLRKEFKKGRTKMVAVENLYLDMQENQITALLGHNGAGKTTTMFMLTGFIPPTKGTALIDGYNIRTNIDRVRRSLGMCPQHDVLFDTLTVAEHLEFFDRLKGRSGSEVKQDVDEMITLLHLESKRNKPSKSLSGGMKRKLSVGIALIGGSKIVILDEPTSGMDPEARRQMWDILQSQRSGRTILLTTHFMDEADYLGDRIAIMSSGKLVCCGSSLFLKKKYGVGYHMVMVKEPSCNVDQVEQIINKHVPDAKMESNISAELSFVLPHESSGKFEDLFSSLENNKKSLGITSFGASVTTMEEVFLKVGEGENENLESQLLNRQTTIENGQNNPSYQAVRGRAQKMETLVPRENDVELNNMTNGTSNKVAPVVTTDVTMEVVTNGPSSRAAPVLGVKFHRNKGFALYLQQFWGMFLKRFINSWRSPLVTIVQLLLPMLFTLLCCFIIRTNTTRTDPAALTLSFAYFPNPVVPYAQLDGSAEVNKSLEKFKEFLTSNVTLENAGMQNDSLTNYLANKGETNKRDYINSYIVAGYFAGLVDNATQLIKAHFQGEALHSPALAMNVIGNTLLRYFTNTAKSIEVINHPLPLPVSAETTNAVDSAMLTGFIVSVNIAFGMSFLVATFIVFAIKERTVKAKHCQFVSGVHTSNFWFSAYTWDLFNFLLPTFGIMILFVAFDIQGYIHGQNLGYVFLTFLLYGASILPFTYVMSFVFNVPASGYVWMTVINVFTGITALVVILILKQIPSTESLGNFFQWLFYIFLPNYCFADSIQNIFINYETMSTCELNFERKKASPIGKSLANLQTLDEYCAYLKSNFTNVNEKCCPGLCTSNCNVFHYNYAAWESPGIGKGILFSCVQIVYFFAFLYFLESGLAKNIMQKIVSGTRRSTIEKEEMLQRMDSITSPTHHVDDTDVHDEKERLLNTELSELMKTDSLVLDQIVKYYGDFLAVNHLSVGIKKGECFGLLGVNGAGKTTTFKMLTGDETITGGKAYLDGYSVASDIKEVQQRVGYCPQFDALIDKMTVAETISMYARLRGVRQSDIKAVVKNLISNLLLDEYENKQAGSLSGGNKRKLSTAIALVGDPPIVFLDEPTTGMDPVARRLLWNTLTQVRESGRTLVLTSHSMEECEALCTRLAIMVNGQFKCLGPCQKLKNKFGEGYTLMAKLTIGESHEETELRMESLMNFIDEEFPGSKLKDLHEGLVMYQVSDNNMGWAEIFGIMERSKDTYYIEDYSVSQTTLEQVFINFARAQLPPLEESIKCSAKCRSCCCFFCCCGCCKK